MKTVAFISVFLALCSAQAPNVKLNMYSESLCPGCQSYTAQQLAPAISTIGEIIDFMLYPYGNANEKQNADGTWAYTCQHGVNECIGNMWEACAIEHFNTTNGDAHNTPTWWPFMVCMEASGQAGSASVAQNCATSTGLDWNVLNTCAGPNPAVGTATDGNPLMHKEAVATNSLIPPHQWTPWVVINGTPLTQNQLSDSLIKLVCSAYTGTAPSGCKQYLSDVEICRRTQ